MNKSKYRTSKTLAHKCRGSLGKMYQFNFKPFAKITWPREPRARWTEQRGTSSN
jgi:hypothetical protein